MINMRFSLSQDLSELTPMPGRPNLSHAVEQTETAN